MRPKPSEEGGGGFEKTPQSKHGNGSARAANKGKVKRQLKHARGAGKRKHR